MRGTDAHALLFCGRPWSNAHVGLCPARALGPTNPKLESPWASDSKSTTAVLVKLGKAAGWLEGTGRYVVPMEEKCFVDSLSVREGR
eukprot:5998352-Heterocapsa_arctica.AAC.1